MLKTTVFRIALCAIGCLVAFSCSRSGPPYPPQRALELFELPAGLRIELVASEPDVVDPVAITFDEQGRMYVVEMLDYPLDLRPLGRASQPRFGGSTG